MNILNISLVLLILSTIVKAESKSAADVKKVYEEDMLTTMCRSPDHHFDPHAHICSYCAKGFRYDRHISRCSGTPNILGKCYGQDHYRARTKECVYCESGYVFNEHADIRTCEPQRGQELKKDKEKK